VRSRRLIEWVAALLSVAAGVIHLQFGPIHLEENALYGAFFYSVAFAQLGTAVLLVGLRRRSQLLVWAMIAGNVAVTAVWAQTRFVAVPFGPGAGGREPIGLGDAVCTAFEVALVLTLLPLVAGVRLATVTERAISLQAAGATITTVAVIALPLMAAASVLGPDAHSHTHIHGGHTLGGADLALQGHTHATAGDQAATDVVAHNHDEATHAGTTGAVHDAAVHDAAVHDDAVHDAAHSHAVTTQVSGDHTHPTDPVLGDAPHTHPVDEPSHPSVPGEPPHTHPPDSPPTGPIISIDDPRLTPAQQQAALALFLNTKAGMARYPTVAAAKAAGYTSIGDGGVDGYEHFVNWSYLQDGHELDSTRIESIVAKKNGNGTKTVVTALYILELGKTMADVPPIAGELTTWHSHTNLCWEGHRLVGTLVNGKCTRGVLMVTPPMMHVWMVPQACGPFAALDGHGAGCEHTH
jgi:hypothetical protein